MTFDELTEQMVKATEDVTGGIEVFRAIGKDPGGKDGEQIVRAAGLGLVTVELQPGVFQRVLLIK